ncbi:MAG: ShlB/FhaC/HecB family hemolysin secretion/activation protein [Nitrospira sp. WS110]|nr:ShlB/FhaC/HecB family hemolysin secretion/activation protein [Nitrospira sp. WS110]
MDRKAGVCGDRNKTGINAQYNVLRVLLAAFVAVLLTVELGGAQVPPGLPLPPPVPKLPDKPQPSPPVLPEVESPSAPLMPKQRELVPPIRVTVKDIALQGNTVFTAEQLREVTDPFIKQGELTTEDIETLRLALTRYYVDRGYATSGAIVPDQDLADQILTIQIIEGRLTKIDVEDNYWFREPYIRWRVERGAGPPVNVLTLQEHLQLLQLDPRFTRINANLKPGLALGESHLNLRVTEANPFRARLGFNNYLSPTVGAEQGFLNLEHQNITGFGDQLSVYAAGSSGAHPVITVNYAIPIHPTDTTLSFQYRRFAFAVREEPFDVLDIENRAEGYRIGLRQPLLRSLRHELAVSITGEHQKNESTLLGEPFEFTAGATNGIFKISALRFGQEYLYRTDRQVVAFLSRFSVGFGDVLGSTTSSAVPGSADGRFFAWLGEAQWVRQLDFLRTQLVSRAVGQLTPDHLFPLEQVAVGGRFSVRGYREFALVRDNAVLASLEARIPIYSRAERDVLFVAPFVDFGHSWSSEVGTSHPRTLASVGAGVIWNIPWKDSRFELYYGKQLNRLEIGNGNLQDHGIHLQVVLSAF